MADQLLSVAREAREVLRSRLMTGTEEADELVSTTSRLFRRRTVTGQEKRKRDMQEKCRAVKRLVYDQSDELWCKMQQISNFKDQIERFQEIVRDNQSEKIRKQTEIERLLSDKHSLQNDVQNLNCQLTKTIKELRSVQECASKINQQLYWQRTEICKLQREKEMLQESSVQETAALQEKIVQMTNTKGENDSIVQEQGYKITSISNQMKAMTAEATVYKQHVKNLKSELAKKKQKIKELNETSEMREMKYKEKIQSMKKHYQDREEEVKQVKKLKSELAKKNQKIKEFIETSERHETKYQEAIQSMKKHYQDKEEKVKQVQKLKSELSKKNQKIKELIETSEMHETKYQEAIQSMKKHYQDSKEKVKQIKKFESELAKKNRKIKEMNETSEMRETKYKEEIQSMRKNYQDKEEEVKQVKKLETDLAQKKRKIKELNETSEMHKNKYQEEIQSMKKHYQDNEEKVKQKETEIERLQNDVQNLNCQLRMTIQELRSFQEHASKTEEQLQWQKNKMCELQRGQETAALQKIIVLMTNTEREKDFIIQEQGDKIISLSNQMEATTAEATLYKQQVKNLESDLDQKKQKIKDLNVTNEMCKSKYKKEIQSIKKHYHDSEEEVKQKETEMERLQNDVQNLNCQLRMTIQELRSVQERASKSEQQLHGQRTKIYELQREQELAGQETAALQEKIVLMTDTEREKDLKIQEQGDKIISLSNQMEAVTAEATLYKQQVKKMKTELAQKIKEMNETSEMLKTKHQEEIQSMKKHYQDGEEEVKQMKQQVDVIDHLNTLKIHFNFKNEVNCLLRKEWELYVEAQKELRLFHQKWKTLNLRKEQHIFIPTELQEKIGDADKKELCKVCITTEERILLMDAIEDMFYFETVAEKVGNLPDRLFQKIIDHQVDMEKYILMEEVVIEYRKLYGDKCLRNFAKNIDIAKVIRHSSLIGQDEMLAKIIDNMLNSGAVLDKGGKMSILGAIQKEHFKIICMLFDRGASPEYLSLQQGDTPLHAALSIALERDKGNFTIINKLLDMYEKDPEKFPMLDPAQQDEKGDGLFHVVAKMKYNSTTQKATELLCDRKISALVKNKEGKLPMDYLLNKKSDPRLQFFRLASVDAQAKQPVRKPKSKPETVLSGLDAEKIAEGDTTDRQDDMMAYNRTDETVNIGAPEKVTRKDKRALQMKGSLNREVTKRKIDLPDIPYSTFNPKRPRLEKGRKTRKAQVEEEAATVEVTSEQKLPGKMDIDEEQYDPADNSSSPCSENESSTTPDSLVTKQGHGDMDQDSTPSNPEGWNIV